MGWGGVGRGNSLHVDMHTQLMLHQRFPRSTRHSKNTSYGYYILFE